MLEYFDILNPDGTMAGYKAPRVEAHAKGLWHRAANLWLINNKNEILLQKRAPQKDSFPGLWDLSAAGHVPAGSTTLETIVREANEEIGVEVDPTKLVLLTTIQESFILNDGKYLDNEFRDIYMVKMDLDMTTCQLQEEEVTELKWMPLKEFQRDLVEQKHLYTPHAKEYAVVFDLLDL